MIYSKSLRPLCQTKSRDCIFFWEILTQFKNISHSSESPKASHHLDSLFPSDTLHCLGLRLRVLAEEIFWLKRGELRKSIMLRKTERKVERLWHFKGGKKTPQTLELKHLFLKDTHITTCSHARWKKSGQPDNASNTSTWMEDGASNREKEKRQKRVNMCHLFTSNNCLCAENCLCLYPF